MASCCLNGSEAFSPMNSNPVSVCVVADESNVRAELEIMLARSDGFRCVDSFPNANEALTGMSMNNPQIVLLNVEPPGTEGLECLRLLVGGLRESNVVILTAITQVHDIFKKLKVYNRTEAISVWRGH